MYATITDVRPRVGRPITTSEEALAEVWLSDALRYMRRGFRVRGLDLDTQVGLGDPLGEDIAAFQAEAVATRLRSFDPEGLTSVTRSVDDASVTKRREGNSQDFFEWLTADQWNQLLPLNALRGGASSTRPGFQPDTPCAWNR